jgi:N-acetylneuraminic acid mutarotase
MYSRRKNLNDIIRFLPLVTVMVVIIENTIINSTALVASPLTDSSSIKSSPMWTTGANMITPRTDFTGASLNEKIYIIGGLNNEGKTMNTVEYYDPKTDTWSTASPLPERLDHAAAAVYNGTLYVVGGYAREGFPGDPNPSDRLYIYNPSNDKWNEGKSMPQGRGALTANFINGTLYAVGGVDNSGVSNSNTAYDPLLDEWTDKTPMPTAREHLASAVVDGKLYVIGGRVNSFRHNLDANEVYDPKRDSWTALEAMPSKRGGLAAASSANGNIYVFGGEEPDGTFNNNEKYDPNANIWMPELPMPTARHGLVAAAVNDRIYVVGGGFEPGHSVSGLNEIFVLNKTDN